MQSTVEEPDLLMGEGGHPDPYKSGGLSQTSFFFSTLLALVWSKNKGGGGGGPQTWVITSFEAW